MGEYLPYLVFVGAAVMLAGIFSYAWSTFRGRTKPDRVTWVMWTVAPLIAGFASLTKGAGWATVPVFMSGGASLLVLVASFANPHAYWKLDKLDYVCGIFSVLALVLWAVTRDPDIAVAFSILSSLTSGLPSLVKAWRFPETENINPYVAGLFNGLTSFAAIAHADFASLAYPIYLVVNNICFIIPLSRRKKP